LKVRFYSLILAGLVAIATGRELPQTSNDPVQQLRFSALRLKITLEQDPRYYLDEPVSAGMRVLAKECDRLLDLLEQQPVPESIVRKEIVQLELAVVKLKQIRYDRRYPVGKKSNVTVYYFSAVD